MVKKENKKPSTKEKLYADYKHARRVIVEVCRDCGISFEEMFPYAAESLDESVSEFELIAEINAIKKAVNTLICGYFLEDWMQVMDESFSGPNKTFVIGMVNNMIRTDPINFYPCCSCTFKSLAQLGKNNKDKELNYLEDYGSYSTIEDVTNNYGMILYSNYKDEVTRAFVKGFKKNNRVNFAYVKALFGNVAELDLCDEPQPQG